MKHNCLVVKRNRVRPKTRLYKTPPPLFQKVVVAIAWSISSEISGEKQLIFNILKTNFMEQLLKIVDKSKSCSSVYFQKLFLCQQCVIICFRHKKKFLKNTKTYSNSNVYITFWWFMTDNAHFSRKHRKISRQVFSSEWNEYVYKD